MRVLHVGKYFPPFAGGIENFSGDLLPALEKIGIATAALVHQHKARDIRECDPENIIRVPTYGQLLYTPICPAFPLALARQIVSFQPDLLHIHMPNPSAFWALFSAKARKIPWVIHWHSDVIASKIDSRLALAYKLYRPFEQALLQQAARVICTSPDYLKSSKPLRKWQDKCTIVPLGINPARLPALDADSIYTSSTPYWPQSPTLKVVAIGRLTYYKGHEVLIRAAEQLDSIKILIVGTGERFHFLQEEIKKRGLHDKVELTGHLPEQNLQALIQSADCLCLPSLERTEAFGLVLLEAMRYGKPVIASSVPGSGMNWLVDDKQTGFLVPPGDHSKLAQTIAGLADVPQKAQAMGLAGKQKFADQFHIDRIAVKIKEIYETVLP